MKILNIALIVIVALVILVVARIAVNSYNRPAAAEEYPPVVEPVPFYPNTSGKE